jgi:hypothetical protein
MFFDEKLAGFCALMHIQRVLKHTSGVAIVLLTVWGAGAIYEWVTKEYT